MMVRPGARSSFNSRMCMVARHRCSAGGRRRYRMSAPRSASSWRSTERWQCASSAQ
jgi:hypothetical protein